jgi:hypothetical protein
MAEFWKYLGKIEKFFGTLDKLVKEIKREKRVESTFLFRFLYVHYNDRGGFI